MIPAAPWILRVNLLAGQQIADVELAALVEQLVHSERSHRAAQGACATHLEQQIGQLAPGPQRQERIKLRREVLAGRLPRQPTPDCTDWLAERARLRGLREKIIQAYPGAIQRERQQLVAALRDPGFQQSLAMVAPAVFAESQRYIEAYAVPDVLPAVRKSARKAERGLLQYLSRALTRTSPLARFTAVGFANPSPHGTAPDSVSLAGAQSVIELDRVLLSYVRGGLSSLRPQDSWLGLAPTSAVDPAAGALYILRFTPSGFHRSAVRLTGLAKILVDAVAMGPRPWSELISSIRDHLPDAAEQALDHALQAGILCTYDRPEDCAVTTTELLDSAAEPRIEPLLCATRQALATFGQASAADRSRALAQIAEPLAELSRQARRPAQIPVAEDVILPPRQVDDRPWAKSLQELASVVEFLCVFDWLHDVRLMTTITFRAEFGEGATVPLAEHAQRIVAQVARRAAAAGQLPPNPNPEDIARITDGDANLTQLYLIRRRILAWASAHIDQARAANQQVVTWEPAQLRALLVDLPVSIRRDPLSYGVLTQWDGQLLIFNDGLPGHGMLYSRFLAADRDHGGDGIARLRDRLQHLYASPGHRLVADTGLHRLNVNAHPRVLSQCVNASDWFRLRIQHVPQTDSLQLIDSDGAPVRVVALGTGHPALFPAPLAVASGLITSGRLNNPLIDNWQAQLPWSGEHTRSTPQLQVGSVVLARRRWYPGRDFQAALAAGPDPADALLALAQWRAEHNIPAEVFAKTSFDDDSPRTLTTTEMLPRRKRHKPQYLDLRSAISVRALPKLIQRRSEDHAIGYFEQALPGMHPGRHAAEWIVEFARAAGAEFSYTGSQT